MINSLSSGYPPMILINDEQYSPYDLVTLPSGSDISAKKYVGVYEGPDPSVLYSSTINSPGRLNYIA